MTGVSWSGAATRFLAVRLEPGADLRRGLIEIFDAQPERAGFVAAAVGSLTVAALRMAGEPEVERIAGPLEIVGLSGTLSVDGPHLHLAVSLSDGRMLGGHLMDGARVRTTAEIVLGLAAGVVFERPVDPATGYRELSGREG